MTLSKRWRELINSLPKGVKLLAVSKGHPASSIRKVFDLGQFDFGESRLQEALPKIKELCECGKIRWHFIGRLQSNKVRAVIRAFDVIHSVDSIELAERISRIALEENRSPQVMIQVKFREDPTKGGFSPEELSRAWPKLTSLERKNLQIIGLMTMAPIFLGLTERRELFKECRFLADQLGIKECSMGMSSDWKEALDSGATWIRLGSLLFGARPDVVNLNTDINKD